MRGLPDLCELARASTLLVRADITSVGSAENAGQAGLTTPSDTMTFFNDPTLSATPVTIQVVTVEYVSQGVVAPSTSLTFLFESDHGLVGPTGTPVTSWLFFVGSHVLGTPASQMHSPPGSTRDVGLGSA